LSTLTKILIVLLTISSIFLCGIVVTYVANADNYKKLYEDERQAKQLAVTRRDAADKQLEQSKKQYEQQEDKLNKQITALKADVTTLGGQLASVKRENAELLQRVTDMASVVESASQTAKQQTQLFKDAQEQLKQLEARQTRQGKELDETVAELIAKTAIIETLESDKKRLEEEKYALQSELDKFLRQRGKEVSFVPTVTPEVAPAPPPIPSVPREIGLKAVITAVDLKHAIAEISIGAAHGVKEGMKFFVTRGSQFVCEIVIFSVDAETSVGDLKRMDQLQPKVGDNVSTNL